MEIDYWRTLAGVKNDQRLRELAEQATHYLEEINKLRHTLAQVRIASHHLYDEKNWRFMLKTAAWLWWLAVKSWVRAKRRALGKRLLRGTDGQA